jgi:5-methylcytosine-specific restriction endonuclease McrA
MSSFGQGGTRNWRKVRQQVLDRDLYECQLRLPGCLFGATEVHHRAGLQGTARKDACEPEECIAVCGPCHQRVTQRQSVAAQQQINAMRAARKKLPKRPHPGEMRAEPLSS